MIYKRECKAKNQKAGNKQKTESMCENTHFRFYIDLHNASIIHTKVQHTEIQNFYFSLQKM